MLIFIAIILVIIAFILYKICDLIKHFLSNICEKLERISGLCNSIQENVHQLNNQIENNLIKNIENIDDTLKIAYQNQIKDYQETLERYEKYKKWLINNFSTKVLKKLNERTDSTRESILVGFLSKHQSFTDYSQDQIINSFEYMVYVAKVLSVPLPTYDVWIED